jgi:pimeloyl-ACP methyl ester carboxylesterase
MDNLSEYCAPGAHFNEEMIATAANVSLRIITFTPPLQNRQPVVLFVAGWVSLIKGWREVLKEMTKDFKIYYIETREKISSKVKGKVDYSVEAIGKDIVYLIDYYQLRSKEYLLFGSSLGATTIIDCFRFLSQKPRCLILIGPNAVFRVPKGWLAFIKVFYPGLYFSFKPVVKWYLKTFRLDVKSDYEQYEKYCDALDAGDPWKLKKAVLSLCKYKIWGLLPDIKVPTLIVGASKDKLHEPENLKRIVSLLPSAHYIDLETNKKTHSREMVEKMRQYLDKLV